MEQGRILAAVFLYSFSSLAYEIALTRVFSISLWYHFAFMIISIAMLGIGAAGTALSLYPQIKAPSQNGMVSQRIGLYGLLLGGSITLSYVVSNLIPFDPVRLSWDRTQILYICLYYLVLSTPFFFFGLAISTAFSHLSGRSGLIYGSDLLGAGTGSIAVLYLMSITAPEYTVVCVSMVALAAAFLNGERKARLVCALLALLNACLLYMPGLIGPRMSEYKGLHLAMQYPGAESVGTYYSPFSRIDIFKSPAVRFAPGMSLRYLDPLPEQIGFSIDGADINAITDARQRESLGFLEYLPSSLPYALGRRKDVLILEPRGGLEVLLARHYDAENIYKVDSNPLAIKVIRDRFRDFSGAIYDKNTRTGLGRSWLSAGVRKFDLIDIPLMGASPSGSFGIAEDYRFTLEAFREYLGHLNDDGVLSVHLFILPPPRVELRLLGTIVAAMEEMGIRETDKNIVSIRSWDTICILAKVRPFSPEEIETVRQFSGQMRFDLVYLPGLKEDEANRYIKTPTNQYFRAFRSIVNPLTRETFQRSYLFDIDLARDERPFFNYYLRLGNLQKIYGVMGGKWQYFIEEGYLLPAVFVQVLFLSTALILLPSLIRKDHRCAAEGTDLLYFAFLGLGFMFVEIPLIQRMILPFENPPYAVAAVLSSVLIGSGAGSLLSERFSKLRNRLTIAVLSVVIIAYSFCLPLITDLVAHRPILFKAAYTFVLLVPIGLLMGIPFPQGLKNLGAKSPDAIPQAWAINACLSVLAPMICIMLAMTTGFRVVLWTGAGIYLLAFLTFPKTGGSDHAQK